MRNDFASSRRALVTGATGYIGSNLVRRLLVGGWDVHVITRPVSAIDALNSERCSRISMYEHDGSTNGMIDLMRDTKPSIVFHLASSVLAQHRPHDVRKLIESNVTFGTQLVEAMSECGIKYLVNAGTAWQHYQDAEYSPVNLYAATKQAFEDILSYYIEAGGLKVTTLALFDTYGPNDPRAKLISLLWKAAREQGPLAMSPGEQLIDLVHVDDVTAAFMRAAELLPEQEVGHARFGISSGRPVRLIDLVSSFERATGCTVPVKWGERPYRLREVMVPWATYPKLPGWAPHIAFEAGILETRPSS